MARRDGLRGRGGQVNVISRAHFEESFRFARRSVSDKDVRKYEVFRFVPRAAPGTPRPPRPCAPRLLVLARSAFSFAAFAVSHGSAFCAPPPFPPRRRHPAPATPCS